MSVRRSEYRHEKARWVESARHQLAVARARRLFNMWRVKAAEKKCLQEMLVQSDCKYKSTLTRKALAAWRTRVDQARRNAELSKKGAWFERCRLLSYYYCRWRVQVC